MLSTCPHCGCPNIGGSTVCPECGESLADATLPSDVIRATLPSGGEMPSFPVVERTGHMGKLGANSVALYANQIEDPLIIDVRYEVTLGRRGGNGGMQPGIDLSAYGAYERGVSRVHACIRRTEEGLLLVDEGSSNGTWVNGTLLAAHSAKLLTPGDQFWLGRLRMEIYFVPSAQPASAPEEPITKYSSSSRRANFSEWIKNRSERDGRNTALNSARSE